MSAVRDSVLRGHSNEDQSALASLFGLWKRLAPWNLSVAAAVAFIVTPSAFAAEPKEKDPEAANDSKAPPKPLVVRRDSLPAVFRKPSPATVSELRVMEKQTRELIARVAPSVVAVQVGDATGSGVVISEAGLVLCAAHVCDSPNRNVVFTFPDGKTAKGKTLGTNHGDDAGLMKITDAGKWPFANVGTLGEAVLGDWVIALGHPGGFDLQRSKVARLGRIIALEPDMLQSDCTLVGGDSGGPLFDMHGRVVAIHSRISNSTSANFHVPITIFMRDWERLVKAESWGDEASPARSYVGVRGALGAEGFTINRVDPNSPAEKGGLKVGDVILLLNGAELKENTAFADSVHSSRPGDSMKLRIRRDGEEKDVSVVVSVRRSRP